MLNEAFSRMKETEYFLDKVPATGTNVKLDTVSSRRRHFLFYFNINYLEAKNDQLTVARSQPSLNLLPPPATQPRPLIPTPQHSACTRNASSVRAPAATSRDGLRVLHDPPSIIAAPSWKPPRRNDFPATYRSAVAKSKCLADSNKTRTSAKPTNNQSALRSFHPAECRSHSGPRQPFAALTRDHLSQRQARIATAWPPKTNVWRTLTSPKPTQTRLTTRLHVAASVQIGAASAILPPR